MLKLGTKNIKNLKLGDKTIFKGIKGGKTVYRNYPIFLDYIVFDGKSCIDTGVKTLGTWNITNAVGATVSGIKFLLAVAPAGAGNWFGQTADGYWGVGANNKFDIHYTQKVDVSVTFSTTQIEATIGNTTITREGTNVVEQKFYIGNHQQDIRSYGFVGQVGTCSYINTDGILQLDLRPAIDPCGVVCMYDMVTNKYFYNQGTGTLKAGGRFVESIVFDGNSYIDTGVIPIFGDEFEISADCPASSGISPFGAGTGDCQFVMVLTTTNYFYKYFESGNARGTTKLWNGIKTIKCHNDGSLVIGEENIFGAVDLQAQTVNTNLFIGTRGSKVYNFTGKIGGSKLTGSDGVVKFDLRPYVDENGVACFKDVVTDTLFYNQGTGTLTYIDFERIPYLEFDRTTYIDTEYVPNKNTELTYKVKLYGKQADITPAFGVRVSYGIGCYNLIQLGNRPRLDWNGTGNIVYLNAMVGNTNTLKIGNGRVLLNGSSVATYTQKETELSHSFFIGNMNENGVVYSKNGSKQDVYLCYLSENGIPKRELIPVKRSDGVKCMYDRVENKYYELKVA